MFSSPKELDDLAYLRAKKGPEIAVDARAEVTAVAKPKPAAKADASTEAGVEKVKRKKRLKARDKVSAEAPLEAESAKVEARSFCFSECH